MSLLYKDGSKGKDGAAGARRDTRRYLIAWVCQADNCRAGEPGPPAGMRDGLLRRSEAAALTWGNVELQEDGSGRLHVARSKTDQSSEGVVLYLGPAAVQRSWPYGRRKR